MAVYCERHRCIFFANPQTGSKAIAATLRDKLEGRALPEREIQRDGEVLVKAHHATWQQLIDGGLMSAEQLDGLVKFTGVRNPYDLLVSRYLKRRGRFNDEPEKYRWAQRNPKVKASMEAAQELSFADWVAKQYLRLDGRNRTVNGPLEYLDHADVVIRFEALQQGFDEVMRRVGVNEPVLIAERNVTTERSVAAPAQSGQGEQAEPAEPAPARRHYTEYYDARSRAMVGRVYAPIIERFGYEFG